MKQIKVKLSKAAVKEIDAAINGLLVYHSMVQSRITANELAHKTGKDKQYDDISQIMGWFNQQADRLNELGFKVVKYGEVK